MMMSCRNNIYLLLLLLTLSGCTFIGVAQDVTIKTQGVDLDSDIETEGAPKRTPR